MVGRSLPAVDGSCRLPGLTRRSRDARRARHPDDHGAVARGSRARRSASCTRRNASSRWICSGGSRPASCRRSSAPRRCPPIATMRVHRFRHIARTGARPRRPPTTAPSSTPTPMASTPGCARWPRRRSSTCCCASRPSRGAPEDSMLTAIAMYVDAAGRAVGVRGDARRDRRPCCRRRCSSSWRAAPATGKARSSATPHPGAAGTRAPTSSTCGVCEPAASAGHEAVPMRRRSARRRCRGGRGCRASEEATLGSNNWAVVGRALEDRQRHRRQRHAPATGGAQHLVSRHLRDPRRDARPAATRRLVGRDAARRPADGRGQQRRHRVGIHQLGGRLVGRRAGRSGARRADEVPDARRAARLRRAHRVDRGEGRRRR